MKKSHGPAFRAVQLDMAKCPACRGRAVIKGVFHELPCVQCNASGWVAAIVIASFFAGAVVEGFAGARP